MAAWSLRSQIAGSYSVMSNIRCLLTTGRVSGGGGGREEQCVVMGDTCMCVSDHFEANLSMKLCPERLCYLVFRQCSECHGRMEVSAISSFLDKRREFASTDLVSVLISHEETTACAYPSPLLYIFQPSPCTRKRWRPYGTLPTTTPRAPMNRSRGGCAGEV